MLHHSKKLSLSSSNRTFMELKYKYFSGKGCQSLSSNRTFMELKFEQKTFCKLIDVRSNRTFMELKFVKLIELVLSSIVLIVPLWN